MALDSAFALAQAAADAEGQGKMADAVNLLDRSTAEFIKFLAANQNNTGDERSMALISRKVQEMKAKREGLYKRHVQEQEAKVLGRFSELKGPAPDEATIVRRLNEVLGANRALITEEELNSRLERLKLDPPIIVSATGPDRGGLVNSTPSIAAPQPPIMFQRILPNSDKIEGMLKSTGLEPAFVNEVMSQNHVPRRDESELTVQEKQLLASLDPITRVEVKRLLLEKNVDGGSNGGHLVHDDEHVDDDDEEEEDEDDYDDDDD